MELSQEQINQLQQLGIEISQNTNPSVLSKTTQPSKNKINPIFPLLSISGLTILSFSGMLLLKNSSSKNPSSSSSDDSSSNLSSPTPTQVPKSIQHYLLTSQQYYSSAVQLQQSNSSDQTAMINALNQSITAATTAIKEFPQDYRGFYQRARIYQSVAAKNPSLLDQAISDLSSAQKLEPNNAEITRSLASAYAQKGDAQNTINFLSQTITLEPTKAQNFYDLAKIQQQVGLLSQAINTYNQLLSLVTDSSQKTQIESEKSAIEKIIAQNPGLAQKQLPTQTNPSSSPTPLNLDSPTIQALADSSLIVAAPEKLNQIQVSSLTDSNSLSGTATLTSGQTAVNINNSQLTDTSQVYVSAISGGKNQNLQVLSKSKDSFTVGLSSPINENIEFKWWIIN